MVCLLFCGVKFAFLYETAFCVAMLYCLPYIIMLYGSAFDHKLSYSHFISVAFVLNGLPYEYEWMQVINGSYPLLMADISFS